MLEIQHDQIRVLHQLTELTEKRFFSGKRPAGRIDRGVDAFGFSHLEKFKHEVYLQQGFTSAYSNAAVISPVGFITQSEIQNSTGAFLLTDPQFPGIGIVAILTAHFTAL